MPREDGFASASALAEIISGLIKAQSGLSAMFSDRQLDDST